MYYYEHTNGSIISKPDKVVDPIGPVDYFDSPFVVKWWHEPDTNGGEPVRNINPEPPDDEVYFNEDALREEALDREIFNHNPEEYYEEDRRGL